MSSIISQPFFYAGLLAAVQTVRERGARIVDYYIFNPNVTPAFVQFFDVAEAASVSLGTTTPVKSIGIPGGAAANLGGFRWNFQSGVQIAATTTATGSTAPGSGLTVNIGFE